MTPGKYPLSLYRGDSYSWSFVLWTDTDKTLPADLTGVTAKAQIRDRPGGTKEIITLACEVVMPNTVAMILDAASSARLATTAAVWDLQLTYESGEVATILAGAVTVTADVTDSTVTPALAMVRKA